MEWNEFLRKTKKCKTGQILNLIPNYFPGHLAKSFTANEMKLKFTIVAIKGIVSVISSYLLFKEEPAQLTLVPSTP